MNQLEQICSAMYCLESNIRTCHQDDRDDFEASGSLLLCTAQSHDPHVMDVQCDHDIDHYVDLDAGEVVGHDHDGSGGAGQHLCTAYLGRRKHWMAAWTPVPPMDLVRPPATPTWTPACLTCGATTAKVPPCPAMAWDPQSPPWGRWTSVPGPLTTRRSMGVPSISASRVSIHSFIS